MQSKNYWAAVYVVVANSQCILLLLARLLSEQKPDRLFIEPTGLGHPSQLFDQLTRPHWQNSLAMRALVTVVDGSRLHDTNWVRSKPI